MEFIILLGCPYNYSETIGAEWQKEIPFNICLSLSPFTPTLVFKYDPKGILEEELNDRNGN